MPRNIFFVCGCRMDILFNGPTPYATRPGGNMPNAAIELARIGWHVAIIGEAATDTTGRLLVEEFDKAGVDTGFIDRYPDGATTIDIIYDGQTEGTFYSRPPLTRLVVKWPRIGPDDIVVFGNWFALDPRTRDAVAELVDYAIQRKALVVYLPGFARQLQPSITHVMPMILDYMEKADVIVTFNDDPANVFGATDAAACYSRNTSFYADFLVHITPRNVAINHPKGAAVIPAPARRCAEASLLASLLAHIAAIDNIPAKSLIPHILTWTAAL